MRDQDLINLARGEFLPGTIIGDVIVRQVREVGEQRPSDDPFLVCAEGIKVGTWRDYASKLYRRSDLVALFGPPAS